MLHQLKRAGLVKTVKTGELNAQIQSRAESLGQLFVQCCSTLKKKRRKVRSNFGLLSFCHTNCSTNPAMLSGPPEAGTNNLPSDLPAGRFSSR